MAIQLEFLNLVVPIHRIEEIYPHGWAGCLYDHAKSINRVVWYDNHLFRTGTMDTDLMDNLLAKWTGLGFDATALIDGKTMWRDFCVLDAFGASDFSCNWLEYDRQTRSAWLRGTERGDAVGREHFRRG